MTPLPFKKQLIKYIYILKLFFNGVQRRLKLDTIRGFFSRLIYIAFSNIVERRS
jgi:hypothetical protein